MCIQSTLYASLAQGMKMAEKMNIKAPAWVQPAKRPKDGTEWEAHLPDDGALLSPNVEVFRAGTNTGYAFQDNAVRLEAVVSVAMPNKNTKMSDSPVDAHPDAEMYQKQLMTKWRAVLTAAASCADANYLVVPDAGCGVFYNKPEDVGVCLAKVLKEEFAGRFEGVVIAFPGGKAGEAFASSALGVFADQPKETQV
mmetsp:Transcript_26658/g.46984  ORF Transcript_26658/g.46984 Transcript_26658/m.46984 type:complete len:196 (-) Transcript_26658:79-666(-)